MIYSPCRFETSEGLCGADKDWPVCANFELNPDHLYCANCGHHLEEHEKSKMVRKLIEQRIVADGKRNS